jgi:outer membrane receptor for ferrienterochelin and colicin
VKYYIILLISLFSFSFSFAQRGKISGKVTNNRNEALVGVTVKLGGSGKATAVTNVEGRYTISVEVGKKYELSFSYVGYTEKIVDGVIITKVNGEEQIDILLEESKKNTSEVTVKASARSGAKGETVNAMIAFQKNTNTVASVVSAEAIKRSPDRNTSEVLKRTPGASIQEGKFIVVRGLADRYNQAMLNGILLTSTEPDRKTFSFDMIPSSMIDNIIINKAFVPELPGEWAGGLIQVNTKDIPTKSFFNIQLGTGFNTQTIGKGFYRDQKGNTDWLGWDDGTRDLPNGYTTKSNFDLLSPSEKTAIGKQMRNAWVPISTNAGLNASLQMNGGFVGKLFGKKVGGSIGVNYNRNNRLLKLENKQNAYSSGIFSTVYDFADDKFVQDLSLGATGTFSMQLNNLNKVSVKTIVNINSPSTITLRQGPDFDRGEDIKGTELNFNQNTFFTVQVSGDHSLTSQLKLKWYGAFNILDGYVPDQRRIFYSKTLGSNSPYSLAISNTLSQQSGSRIYQNLSDYIYTAGGDLSYNYNMFNLKQTLKVGYMFQVKDRLYDAQLFANYLYNDNPTLRLLPVEQAFAPTNFGNGSDNLIGFGAISNKSNRYLANTILNAGFLQFDNQLSNKLRLVWGLRVENYDQLIGSVKKFDSRHTYSKVTDFLPGINATYKLNEKTNIRLSVSQTVIRPELRELADLSLYDFELNSSVQGNPALLRTKITNFDLRYEVYPKSGEVLTAGVFYKDFKNPIEQILNINTFSYRNAPKAKSYGVEVEYRKKLDFAKALKNFTFQANASYIYSQVNFQSATIDRPLQGQSPYVLNMGLMYDLEKHGLSATLLFNQIGQRIYLVGDIQAAVGGSPDVWEAPRPVFDFQVAKKVLKRKGELRLNVADILNKLQYFYQNAEGSSTSFQKNKDAYRFTRQFGTTIGLTFNYTIL